jgi:hypothetical protein
MRLSVHHKKGPGGPPGGGPPPGVNSGIQQRLKWRDGEASDLVDVYAEVP